MPTLIRGLTIVLFLAASPRFASAGGPVQSLPKDGCWVKFFLEVEVSDPDGVNSKHTGSWTISSVGMKTVNGEKCRWIEIEEHIDKNDDGKPFTRWYKCLVREKDVKPGGDLLGHLVEYWHKEGLRNKAVKKTDSSSLMLPMFLRGTPKTGRPVAKAKRVVWQKGEFTIPQAEEQTQTTSREENRLRVTVRDLVWKKVDIPFGTAAVNSSVRLIRKGKPTYTWVRKLSLADHGTNAKSKLPEAK